MLRTRIDLLTVFHRIGSRLLRVVSMYVMNRQPSGRALF